MALIDKSDVAVWFLLLRLRLQRRQRNRLMLCIHQFLAQNLVRLLEQIDWASVDLSAATIFSVQCNSNL